MTRKLVIEATSPDYFPAEANVYEICPHCGDKKRIASFTGGTYYVDARLFVKTAEREAVKP